MTESQNSPTDDGDGGAYRCFGGCGRHFESLDEMVTVAGRGDRSPRHFCKSCARSLPYTPEKAYKMEGSA